MGPAFSQWTHFYCSEHVWRDELMVPYTGSVTFPLQSPTAVSKSELKRVKVMLTVLLRDQQS